MEEDSKIIKVELWGGPNDGETVEIHKENLKIKPIISIKNKDGSFAEYTLDDNGKFVWITNPAEEQSKRKWYLCDDDGNVISEEEDVDDAFRKLDDFNDDSEQWKYK